MIDLAALRVYMEDSNFVADFFGFGGGEWDRRCDPPTALALIARVEAAEERHRDLASRLGFGDNITEPMADNDTIVKWFDERSAEANEWVESQMWRTDCYLKGHPDGEDCFECDPSLRLATAESAVARVRALAEDEYAPYAFHESLPAGEWAVLRADAVVTTLRDALAGADRGDRRMSVYPKATAPETSETTAAANERADRWQARCLEARARAETAEAKLSKPCGSCHPCNNWANQTWVNAGERLPHLHEWQEMRVAVARVRGLLDAYGEAEGTSTDYEFLVNQIAAALAGADDVGGVSNG